MTYRISRSYSEMERICDVYLNMSNRRYPTVWLRLLFLERNSSETIKWLWFWEIISSMELGFNEY